MYKKKINEEFEKDGYKIITLPSSSVEIYYF